MLQLIKYKTDQININPINQTLNQYQNNLSMDSRILLSASKVQPLSIRTPSESTIVEKKNIQKRLENLSLKQLERIYLNLSKQNQRLKNEVQKFGEKVKKLIQSKKYDAELKPNPLIEQQVLKFKKQLEAKYQTMQDLKQQIKRQTSKNIIEETTTNNKQKQNEVKAIQIQIQQLLKQKQKLTKTLKDNQIDFEQYLPTQDLTPQTQALADDNKNLKKKVYNISVLIKQNQRTAKEAFTKIYTLKKQGQFFQTNSLNRIKSFSVLNNHEAKTQGNQLKTLEQQIQMLRKKKIDVQSELTSDKMAKLSAKQKKQKQISQLLEYHKKLFKRRVRELTQLNYLQKKQADMKLRKQLQLQKSKVPLLERASQTQNFIKKEYRKDWIGKQEGIPFDDTDLLQFKQSCLIKSILVYRTTDRIVFIRFGYENPSIRYKYQTKIPFDKEGLKKIQNKRVTSKGNGYLVNLNLSITKNIITRVESLWSDGDSSVQGWETEESSKYRFDILQKQRPIAFYGNVVPHARGFYALQSLGCEILQNQ